APEPPGAARPAHAAPGGQGGGRGAAPRPAPWRRELVGGRRLCSRPRAGGRAGARPTRAPRLAGAGPPPRRAAARQPAARAGHHEPLLRVAARRRVPGRGLCRRGGGSRPPRRAAARRGRQSLSRQVPMLDRLPTISPRTYAPVSVVALAALTVIVLTG